MSSRLNPARFPETTVGKVRDADTLPVRERLHLVRQYLAPQHNHGAVVRLDKVRDVSSERLVQLLELPLSEWVRARSKVF